MDRFWHRYFYQTLLFGMGLLCLCVLPSLLWEWDEAWLRNYVIKSSPTKDENQPRSRIDQLAAGFWFFDLSAGSAPRGAIADYFRTYGLPSWSALKATWDKDAVPSLGPVIAEIDRIIAGRDPTQALMEASPDIEKFYFARRTAILQELRDYATDPNLESTPSA